MGPANTRRCLAGRCCYDAQASIRCASDWEKKTACRCLFRASSPLGHLTKKMAQPPVCQSSFSALRRRHPLRPWSKWSKVPRAERAINGNFAERPYYSRDPALQTPVKKNATRSRCEDLITVRFVGVDWLAVEARFGSLEKVATNRLLVKHR